MTMPKKSEKSRKNTDLSSKYDGIMTEPAISKTAIRRNNSPAIYPQNRFSRVPTLCYPGVAFCSKTAILGPGSGSESDEIYDADSRVELRFVGVKAKKPDGNHRALKIKWWQGPGSNW